MSLPLPPDPYKALGIAKDAAITEVKSAYRKLVLKCHPDKVQDPTLKAQKQNEFQKVQEAYELLTDDTKRTDYDEKVKMFAFRDSLRSQAPKSSSQGGSRSSPTAHMPSPFEYEVRTAEPRSARFKTSRAPSPVRVYTTGRPASFEEEPTSRMYDTGSRSARKTASYEERKKVSTKDEERRRRADEEREHERWEKEVNRKQFSASKKSRDKERKKGSEEKSSRRTAFIVDEEDSEDGYRPRTERRSSKKSDDKIHVTSEKGVNEFIITERTRKLHHAGEAAAQYILAANMKAGKTAEVEFRPRPIQRSETYHAPPYATRYPAPPPQPYMEHDSDEDRPRRSSARPRSRRPSDQLPPRPHNPSRNSAGSEPFIVTADPSSRKPSLQTHISAPPLVSEPRRKEPQRSQTIQAEYTRRPSATAPPPLARASTYSEKPSRPSRLHTTYNYDNTTSDSSDSDSDAPIYTSPSRSSRPPPSSGTTQKRYVVEKSARSSGAVPVARSSHRKVLRDDSYPPRDRSESPRGTPARASVRSSPRAQTAYYTDEIHIPAASAPSSRSKPRSAGVKSSSSKSSGGGGPFFGEVKYAAAFRPEDVSYGEYYRGGPTSAADYYQQSRRGEATAYA